uniref:Uncharacterized protein n=2 Tax=Picea TaxID=3328 RepID=A0A101LXL7_PICGL|nr:hypothetical protein ABT39_MTgene5416 [Picea glauca]QHR91473.1 hypothetical protein Q903MT_gene5508 [Picea sitchensis]
MRYLVSNMQGAPYRRDDSFQPSQLYGSCYYDKPLIPLLVLTCFNEDHARYSKFR